MKSELKQRWVEALRSGKYKQTKGRLMRPDNSYCCLGVLCEIEGVAKEYIDDQEPPRITFEYKGTYGVGTLPYNFANEIGLSHRYQDELTDLNDTQQFTFDKIADWIEKNI